MSDLLHAPPAAVASPSLCRGCGAELQRQILDLGMSPLCESFLRADQLNEMEPFYPLRVLVCEECWLVQLQEYVSPLAIFDDYAYFSSYSASWVEHARRYCSAITERLRLNERSFVIEVASNDGYLLQHMVARGLRVLGIEPARNVAVVARERGVPTETVFLGAAEAGRIVATHGQADLVIGNNVLAQVPDLHDFLAGIAALLAPHGTATMEFPHFLRLLEDTQFDTIYHEHFSYFSLRPAASALACHGLQIIDVEELPTHGGSLRLFIRHAGVEPPSPRVADLEHREEAVGIYSVAAYESFEARVQQLRRSILRFLIDARDNGKHVAGYGAPGKGNTLLNYCGVRSDLLEFTADRNPFKHGKFLPGTHIPVFAPEKLAESRPDFIFILPWNLKDEIVAQLRYVRDWGGQLVVPVPEVHVV